MSKFLTLTKNTGLALFIILIASFVIVVSAHAQTATSSGQTGHDPATRHGITFPIAELGNCSNLAACKTYCSDPVNANTCISFAKSKGFYKQEQESQKKQQILAAAKTSLGCDSEESCRTICSDPANYDKCNSFAQNQSVTGGYVQKPDDNKILNQAKQTLGCSSADSCKSFCEQAANQDKCSTFARQAGLNGGQIQIGPGGCTSAETCRAFCSDPNNFNVCKGFANSSGRGTFSGPGGCNSEESCRTYCQTNPDQCRSQGGILNPQEACLKTPHCSWNNNTCQCGSFNRSPQPTGYSGNNMSKDQQEAACKAGGGTCDWNSGVCNCKGFKTPTGTNNSGTGNNSGNYGGYNSGGYYNGTYEDPATACRRGGGCTWTGSTCQCPTNSTNQSSGSVSTQTGSGGSSDPASECGKHAGCTWTGSTCSCAGQTQPQPQPQPTSTPPTSTPPTSTPPPSTPPPSTPAPSPNPTVKGVTNTRNLLDQILDFFRR